MVERKYYIFLTHCVCDIGGMQLYTSRKIEYLKSQGWTPLVFFYRSGDIEIDNLKIYSQNHIQDLRFCVGNVSESARKKVLKQIGKFVNDAQDVIVESCCLALGTWGEYIASNFQGKHILYIIDEIISQPTPKMYEFLEFKANQKLLYCIKQKVLADVFKNKFNLDEFVLRAAGASSNNISDSFNPIVSEIPDGIPTILSLGRLDKPYIGYLFDSIVRFVNSNPERKFNFVIVGDTPIHGAKQGLLSKFENIENVNIFDLGFLWPIPRQLFSKVNVALGSAGSIMLCNRQGVPSIAIDVNDYEAIGVYGQNTSNTLFRDENDPVETIIDWLNLILIENKIIRREPEIEQSIDYSAHQRIIDMKMDRIYFPTDKSARFVSHPFLRSAIIRFDQSAWGHRIIQKLWRTKWFNNVVNKVNRNGYSKQ